MMKELFLLYSSTSPVPGIGDSKKSSRLELATF